MVEDYKMPEKTSFYHDGMSQIMRLDYLWQKCNNLSIGGNLKDWKWTLDALWRELSADAALKDEQEKDVTKKYSTRLAKCNEKIIEAGGNPSKQYTALGEKEQFIRYLQEKVGKGSKKSYSDDSELM